MCICEAHPLVCKLVNIWRLDFRGAIASQVAIAQIVRHDEYDVGSGICSCHLSFGVMDILDGD
jgi:hypothetical protein